MSFLSPVERMFPFLFRHRIRGTTRPAQFAGIGDKFVHGLKCRNKYGALLELDPFNHIGGVVLRYGLYASEVLEACRQNLPEDGVFWDVGADSGHISVTMKLLFPASTVVSFEPSPRELATLAQSATLNDADILILPWALSNETAIKPFHICKSHSGRNALAMWGDEREYSHAFAQCIRGDEFIRQGFPVPHVIKIDVEGSELEVLQGMVDILSDPRCRCIVYETGAEVLDSANPINTCLPEAGFQMRPLRRNEPTAHNLENYVAVKWRRG